MTVSITIAPSGPPYPLNAVFDGRLVFKAYPVASMFRKVYPPSKRPINICFIKKWFGLVIANGKIFK